MSAASPDQRVALLDEFIRKRCIIRAVDQRIVSSAGRDQAWLIDLWPLLLNGRTLAAVAGLFWERFSGAMPFQICGLEAASLPILSAIVREAERHGVDLNAFIIRKERKASGLARDIEGDIGDEPIVVVDDLVITSNSLEKVRVTLAEHGRRIERAFVVLDYRSRRADAWRERHAIEVDALFDRFGFELPTLTDSPSAAAHTYQLTWSSAAPGANHFLVAPRSSPACDGQTIFVGTDGGELRALDGETGVVAWTFRTEGAGPKGIWSSPVIVDGRIVFGACNGSVYCLDRPMAARYGKLMWPTRSTLRLPSHQDMASC